MNSCALCVVARTQKCVVSAQRSSVHLVCARLRLAARGTCSAWFGEERAWSGVSRVERNTGVPCLELYWIIYWIPFLSLLISYYLQPSTYNLILS